MVKHDASIDGFSPKFWSLDRYFYRGIVHIKRRSYAKFKTPVSDVPIDPYGVHNFGVSSPRVIFFDVYEFPLFINNK